MRSTLGLDITLMDVTETDHSSIRGLAGGSVNGSLTAANNKSYSIESNETMFLEYGNTCKWTV